MRSNRVRELWASNAVVIGGWLSIGNSYSAEIVGCSGVDCVTIDLQHGMIDVQDMIGMLQAISATPAIPFVRVPSCDPPLLMKALDAGAYGVICPMIETVKQAQLFVESTRYPPQGSRSLGPGRGLLYGGSDYFRHADSTIIRLAMIESAAGLATVEEICDVDGLDGIFIGPSDLSIALGHGIPSDELTDPKLSVSIERCRVAANKRGRHAGIFCASGAIAARQAIHGFDFIVPNSDANLLKLSLAAEVRAARQRPERA